MISKQSAEWQAVEKACRDEIAKSLDALAVTGTATDAGENLRGRIAFARDLLRLVEPEIADAGPIIDASGYPVAR